MNPEYTDEFVTLYQTDANNLTSINADACITDPPYGISYWHSGGTGPASTIKNPGAAIRKSWVGKDAMILGDDSDFDPSPWLGFKTVALFGANHFSHLLPKSSRWICWDKVEFPESYGKFSFSDCELIWTNQKGTALIYHQLWQGCRRRGECNAEGKLHPNQKPVALMAWLLDKLKVPKNATVFDPFMGSGTTAIACLRTGRKFVGSEKDPSHFATALARITNEIKNNTPVMI